MALRVLLADESSTIKKVFQLALQDFAVEVRPVNVGVDVVPVAQNFKPDIIFADVLLQKKSGYDVAAEVKQNPHLNNIPVVLMWSGFMELDEDKYQASHANAQLEKPFDVTALRKLVSELVPRTQNQRLSQFLSFPKMPEIEEPTAPESAAAAPAPEEDFKQVPIPKMKGPSNEKYRINLPPEELDPDHIPVELDARDNMDSDPEEDQFAVREPTRANLPAVDLGGDLDDDEVVDLDAFEPPPPPITKSHTKTTLQTQTAIASPAAPQPKAPAKSAATATPAATPRLELDEAQLEQMIRKQAAEMIESVVWKVVPDLAAQLIERELSRLLKEREAQQPY